MTDTTCYDYMLDAVIAWADEKRVTWDYDESKGSLMLEFEYDSFAYMLCFVARQDDTLTLGVSAKVVGISDELAVRRRVDSVMMEMKYGCFVLESDTSAILWRDSIFFVDEDDCEAEVIGELFECGHDAFKLLRLHLPELFGATVADARLAQMEVRGRVS